LPPYDYTGKYIFKSYESITLKTKIFFNFYTVLPL